MKRVGHAGTLDPLATGVLVLCVGAATRLSEYVMQSTKRYQAQVYLGVTTDTYDAGGVVQRRRDISGVTRGDVERQLAAFRGEIEQVPPIYSAVWQGGRRLYELARAGQIVERKARRVTIERLEIVDWSPPLLTLNVVCSAGTYIRSLAHDLGEQLSVGAHLAGLVRMASGSFQIEDAISLEALLASEHWQQYLLPVQMALAHWPAVHLNAADTENIRHGRSVADEAATGDGLALAFAVDGSLAAVVKAKAGKWRPEKVFLPEKGS